MPLARPLSHIFNALVPKRAAGICHGTPERQTIGAPCNYPHSPYRVCSSYFEEVALATDSWPPTCFVHSVWIHLQHSQQAACEREWNRWTL